MDWSGKKMVPERGPKLKREPLKGESFLGKLRDA